jgi:cytochrome c-type biogenesis protein CcmH
VIAAVRRSGAAIALALALLPSPALAQEPRASLPDIEDEVMCTVCGTPLELSESPQAERQRALIRRLIDEGRDKEEIKDALVAEYGPEVLATPGDEGFDLSAWIVPALAFAAAAALIALALIRWRREGEPPAAERIDPDDAARLADDMARHEP